MDPYVLENTRRILQSLYMAHTGPGDGRECTYEFLACMTAYVPSTGKKYVHAQLSDTGCKPVELRAGPYDHPWVTGILALMVPVNYPGAPCDLGMSGECAERWS